MSCATTRSKQTSSASCSSGCPRSERSACRPKNTFTTNTSMVMCPATTCSLKCYMPRELRRVLCYPSCSCADIRRVLLQTKLHVHLRLDCEMISRMGCRVLVALMFKLHLEELIWTKTHAQILIMCRETACGSLYLKKATSPQPHRKRQCWKKKEKHLKQTLHLTLQDGI